MADENITEAQRQLSEAMAQVQRDLAMFGRVTQQTSDQLKDAEMKGKVGVENFTKAANTAGAALGTLAGAGIESAKAMYEGKKGAAAFNSSLDEMSKAAALAGTALTLLVPGGIVIKGIIAGFTMAATAAIAYAKAANEMADKQYKAYSGLQKSGAAAADGMAGVFRDAKKLGLSMNELDSMVDLVASSSQDLAQFSGTVFEGRKKFADMGQALEGNRAGFLKMGLSMQDVNEGMMGYLKTVTRTGRAQSMTQEQMAASARNYIYEQDALAKITGMNAKKQQEATERALQNEQFLAKIRTLESQGKFAQADELKKLNIYYSQMGEEAAAGYQATVNGNLRNKDAQRLNMTAQGEVLRGIQAIEAGTATAATVFDKSANAVKRYEAGPGRALAALDAGAEVGLKLATQVNFANAATQDRAELEKKVNAELEKQGAKSGKAADAATDAMGNLQLAQINANKAIEEFVDKGVVDATKAMTLLANTTAKAAMGLDGLVHGGWLEKIKNFFGFGEKTQSERVGAGRGGNVGTTNQQGMDFGQMSAADGGIFKGPQTGYPVLMHGTEAIIPMDKMGGSKMSDLNQNFSGGGSDTNSISASSALAAASALIAQKASQLKIENANKEIVKDTKTKEELTDKDAKLAKEYNEEYKAYVEEMQQLMKAQLETARSVSGNTAGAGGAGGGGGGGAGGMTMGGGVGLKIPTAGAAPGMGGAQGLQIGKQDDLKKLGLNLKAGDVQAEGASINPKIVELAKSIQSNVPGFNYFSAFNDKFHQEKAPSSKHAQGLAVDFTTKTQPSKEEGASVVSWLKQQGASLAIDEYNNPSSHATAGHFHTQIPGYAKGGIVQTPQLAMVGEERPEAVIPLEGGAVPVKINGMTGQAQGGGQDMKMMMDALMSKLDNSQMLSLLQEILSTQKAGVDVQTKMLRAQS